MTPITDAIDTYLQTHLDEYIAETARLCAQPSISARNEGVQECAALVVSMLQEHGFDARIYPTAGQPAVIGHAKGKSDNTDRTLLLYNHYDVQPPEPLELWTTPPFEPTIRNGALYARGAWDDKGELVSRLAALDALRAAHGGELPCNVTYLVEGEEEIGSPSLAAFVQEHRDRLRSDACIWEAGTVDTEGRHQNYLGLRGILVVELEVETMARDGHSGYAHYLPNAAWRLVRALASLKDESERIRIPGFYDDVRPPTERDLALIDAAWNPSTEQFARETLGVKRFVRGATGPALERAVFEPTCNIQGITTGYQGQGTKTVIPAKASAKLDFRLVPDQNPDDLVQKLRAHLDREGFEDVKIVSSGGMLAFRVRPDDPFVQLTSQTAEEVYGKPSVLTPMIGGSGPMAAVGQPLDVPIVMAGVGYYDNRVHAPDEHIRLSDFLNGARHVARIIDGFAAMTR